jgi:Ca-activated chloride channel family protein
MRTLLIAFTAALALAPLLAQEGEAPVFKSGVERATITAVVRNSRGKLITNLTERDFELIDSGRRRPLIGVWSEASPASVAILMDASGSMSTKFERAKETANMIVAGLKPGIDELALYAFDTSLTEVRPFSTQIEHPHAVWASMNTFGETSLWDVIAQTARQIAVRQNRRALVVVTDGVDSASRMTPAEVSAVASAVDVPVYILVVSVAPEEPSDEPVQAQGPLSDLAAWTGGDSLVVYDSQSVLSATQRMLAELQHQYVIAFEPSAAPGWHPLMLRTRKNGLFVRSRTGYHVGVR